MAEQTSCSRKIGAHEHCLKLEGWQGRPEINKVKQLVCLFSHENVYSVNLFRHNKRKLVSEDLSLLIKM